MTWDTANFSEIFRVKHGYAFKSEYFDSVGPYVLLTPGNFYEEGGFKDQGDKQRFFTGEVPPSFILNENDLLIAMTEQAEGLLGSAILIPEASRYLHNQRLGLIVDMDEERIDKFYLYYLFNTREVRQQISASASGTKVKHTAPERVGRVKVKIPPVVVQKCIVQILSAYDDLIENNRRRMALLEDAARQLYREWFVRLRFPGREHTRIVDGVPEGWQRKTAYEVMHVQSGGTPKTTVSDFWDGTIPFFTPKDAVENCYVLNTEKHLTDAGLKNCNSRVFSKNTLFITARGTVGKLNLAQQPMAMNQSCYALLGKDSISQYFLLCTLREAIEHFRTHAGGAVFDAIVVDTFKLIPFVVPERTLVSMFDDTVRPMYLQIENLLLQNQKLKAARDLLLPRLMRGELL